MESDTKCPVMHGQDVGGTSNQYWWPNQLKLKVLQQNPAVGDPMGADFNYSAEFKTLDLESVRKDIDQVMATSQEWWPADYGHYGPFFIRMAWHSEPGKRHHRHRWRLLLQLCRQPTWHARPRRR